MSQHNITGSEAFDRRPFVIIRSVRTGGLRRRKARGAMAFVAGAVAAIVGGAIALAVIVGPTLFG